MKKIVLMILIIAWALVIFSLSSQPATKSDKVSTGVTKKVVKALDFGEKMSEKEVETIANDLNHIVRKCAHFCAYAILAILLMLLLKECSFKYRNAMILSVVLSGLYACSDEIHQTFIRGRSGEIRDVGIDTLGATFGVSIIYFVNRIIQIFKNKKKSAL